LLFLFGSWSVGKVGGARGGSVVVVVVVVSLTFLLRVFLPELILVRLVSHSRRLITNHVSNVLDPCLSLHVDGEDFRRNFAGGFWVRLFCEERRESVPTFIFFGFSAPFLGWSVGLVVFLGDWVSEKALSERVAWWGGGDSVDVMGSGCGFRGLPTKCVS
jgi:hypothetical protein